MTKQIFINSDIRKKHRMIIIRCFFQCFRIYFEFSEYGDIIRQLFQECLHFEQLLDPL